MVRAALYARVSTDRQAKEGDSIPAQMDALKKYVDDNPDMVLAGIYVDDGVSGTRSDRDELNRLLDDVKRGLIDVILLTKLDRLYRSIRHYLNMMDVLDKYGVGWKAIWENYETVTPQGRLIINATMSFAQFEAEQTSQRIKQVFSYKAAKGEVLSGNVTPGYKIVDKHLVQDELAPAVKEVFEHYARTGKLYETVRISAPGLPKTKQGIKTLLQRRIYTGEAYGNPNFCEPIIDKELFEKVQLQLSRNIKAGRKQEYLFTGIVRCAECGVVMASGGQTRYGKRTNFYRCPRHFQSGTPRCDNYKVLYEHSLEKYLVSNLELLVGDAKYKAKVSTKPIEDTSKKKNQIRLKLNRLTDLYIDGLIDKEEYATRKDILMNDLASLEMPVEAPTSQILAFEPKEAINVYHMLTNEEKRLFWRSIIRVIKSDKQKNIEVVFL